MFRSERTFRDQEKMEERKDPRYAYLKQCEDYRIMPKARMIIRHQHSKEEPVVEKDLDYSNYSLMKKNANAVAEALKHYPL